jgi:hypothetical protein
MVLHVVACVGSLSECAYEMIKIVSIEYNVSKDLSKEYTASNT